MFDIDKNEREANFVKSDIEMLEKIIAGFGSSSSPAPAFPARTPSRN